MKACTKDICRVTRHVRSDHVTPWPLRSIAIRRFESPLITVPPSIHHSSPFLDSSHRHPFDILVHDIRYRLSQRYIGRGDRSRHSMSDPQPEASGSTTARKVHHLATFVFDAATLNRDTYTKLIEHDGVLHRLVQRLMEKHPVDDTVGSSDGLKLCLMLQLRLGLVITPSPSVICSKRPNFVQDYLSPSSFLGSLPKLASRFVVDGSGQRGTVKWPGLDIEEKGSNSGSGAVLNGIVAGIEVSSA